MDNSVVREFPLGGGTDTSTVEHKVRSGRRRGMSRGYSTNHLPDQVQTRLKAFEETSLPGSLTDCVLYFASIAAVAVLCIMVWQTSMLAGLFCYAFGLLLIARQIRGLELMVHDASHWCWQKENKQLNDLLANCFVSYPTMGTVGTYRKGHFIHHGTYAGEQDPCKRRFASMGLGEVDLSTKWAIMRAVLRWLPKYNLVYYTEIGSKSFSMLGSWALWHLVVFILPLSLIFNVQQALLIWAMFWLVPMLISLPVLRSIAEAEEHDYERGDTEFESTYTNDGLIHHLLWHPWNDGYHQVHHMFPNISARHHHRVHKLLMVHDEIYKAGPIRTKTLQQVAL